MAAAGTWNRRSWFRGFAPSLQPVESRRSELTVARRAMACEFSVVLPFGVRHGVDAGCAALDVVGRLESKLSVFRSDSHVAYINEHAAEAPVTADAEVYALLRTADRLAQLTGGAFDAASGALVDAWGFARGPRRVPSDAERLQALAASGSRHVRLNDPDRSVAFDRAGVRFNLGAIGKGFAIDCALRRMRREFGVASALMQGGRSSLRALGTPFGEPRGWAVDVGDPPVARVWLRDRALGTSGADQQFFEQGGRRFGHILDPRTGWPASGLAAVSVIAASAAEADALSTALFVLGEAGARRFCRSHPEIAAVLSIPGKSRPVVIGQADVEVLV